MVYQVESILRDVRAAIDENREMSALLGEADSETLTLNEIITSKIEEAARTVALNAPLRLLDGGVPFGDAVYWRDGVAPGAPHNAAGGLEQRGAAQLNNRSGWVLLPDDYLRLVVFEMSDWERPVYAAITAADPQYALQRSRRPGLRGTPQKPVVAIVRRAEGNALELYSCKSTDATVTQALYLPVPRIDRDGGIEIPEMCHTAVLSLTGALTLTAIGQTERGAIMKEQCKEQLQ